MTPIERIKGLEHLQFRAHLDSRGALVRVFDDAVMAMSHVAFVPDYALASVNPATGTLRGMHYQRGDAGEARLMTCVSGAVHNISVDLRRDSATFLTCEVNVLNAGDGHAILVPPGCANGWMTLEPNTVLCYQISGGYSPADSTGIRFDDPAFALQWPMVPTVISDADRHWPNFDINRAGDAE